MLGPSPMAVRYVRSQSALSLRWELAPVHLDPVSRRAVEQHWQTVLASAPRAFDGPLLVGVALDADAGRARLALGRSSYAPYAWARAHEPPRPGLHAVGTGVLVFERSSRSCVLLQRGEGVVFDRARVGWVGGVATPPADTSVDPWVHLQAESAIELDEELALDERPFDPARLRFVGAYIDEATLKLEVLFAAAVERCALRGEENTRCVRLAPDALRTWCAANEARAERSMREHLRHLDDLAHIVAELERES